MLSKRTFTAGLAVFAAAMVALQVSVWASWSNGSTSNEVQSDVGSFVASSHCPFCKPVAPTFGEQMRSTDAVLIAELVKRGKRETVGEQIAKDIGVAPTGPSAIGKSDLKVIKVIKGQKYFKAGDPIRAYVFGDAEKGDQFFVTGVEPPAFSWSTLKSSKRVVEYLGKIPTLPKSGAKRLSYFLDYLEDREEIIARDCYDEFAIAPFADVKDLKPEMDRGKLRKWIENKDIPRSRKGLYFTMLSIAGTEKDTEFLEGLMRSNDDQKKVALDSMIACYITLKGPKGLETIDELFLANPKASYSECFSAIAALRFHGTEANILNKKQIVASLRRMLDRDDLADLVIPDLARWEDWSVMDKLVKIFKESDAETSWVRMPIVNYLRACPLPRAKKYMSDLEKLDPKTFKRARAFFPEFDLEDDDEEDEPDNAKIDGQARDDANKPLPNPSTSDSVKGK